MSSYIAYFNMKVFLDGHLRHFELINKRMQGLINNIHGDLLPYQYCLVV